MLWLGIQTKTTRLSKEPSQSSWVSKSLGLFWEHPALQIIQKGAWNQGKTSAGAGWRFVFPFSIHYCYTLGIFDLTTRDGREGKYWENSLFLLTLSQFFIWESATSLIQRQIMWTPCVFLAPKSRIFSDENKLQGTMEKGSEVTLLLAKLEPDTLNNFNSLIC